MPSVPDDAETVTLSELTLAARLQRDLQQEHVSRLARLGRPIAVGLIGCSKAKGSVEAPARALYIGPLFAAALSYAESACDETYVISALRGLVALDERLRPYDRTLSDLPKRERLAWGERVVLALSSKLSGLPLRLTILAGLDYVAPIVAAARPRGWPIDTPLARLSIGERLKWFKDRAAELEKARPRPPRRAKRGAS